LVQGAAERAQGRSSFKLDDLKMRRGGTARHRSLADSRASVADHRIGLGKTTVSEGPCNPLNIGGRGVAGGLHASDADFAGCHPLSTARRIETQWYGPCTVAMTTQKKECGRHEIN